MALENNPEVDDKIPPVSGLVPMIPVLDVERSAAFYQLLGFAVGNRQPREGRMHWAWLYGPNVPDWRRGPNLMLTRSEGAIEPNITEGPLLLLRGESSHLARGTAACGTKSGTDPLP